MGRCPPVYPIGPLIRTGFESESDSSVCLKWLDDQPLQSVLYVAFGSYWTLSPEQLTELAMGLEMSEQRFLWVVRRPEIEINPNRFMERTKGRGLVVWSWAPQLRIRSHGSIGGFLTHCGWSSILESVAFGVPMIAWPLIFDQKMNAVFVGDGLKAGIRVEKNENGIVERGHISLLVKKLMGSEEGKRIRERIMDIKIAAQKAVSKEGSSTLAQVVKSWSSEN
ncbi:hydroquinone glucosyltransferase [Phtheirospermum japonicum]|uniref:Hydroquinone glucosyltransferase n=1 Tax=Phtheirospermum japonicum TaxID=374723 RepID=A0A830BLY7_9LAMI|nr:hydroquinone glucosyltransferase [Phtheirospermum japonicum]